MSTKNKNKNKNKNATVAPKKQATAEKKSVKAKKQAVVRANAPPLPPKAQGAITAAALSTAAQGAAQGKPLTKESLLQGATAAALSTAAQGAAGEAQPLETQIPSTIVQPQLQPVQGAIKVAENRPAESTETQSKTEQKEDKKIDPKDDYEATCPIYEPEDNGPPCGEPAKKLTEQEKEERKQLLENLVEQQREEPYFPFIESKIQFETVDMMFVTEAATNYLMKNHSSDFKNAQGAVEKFDQIKNGQTNVNNAIKTVEENKANGTPMDNNEVANQVINGQPVKGQQGQVQPVTTESIAQGVALGAAIRKIETKPQQQPQSQSQTQSQPQSWQKHHHHHHQQQDHHHHHQQQDHHHHHQQQDHHIITITITSKTTTTITIQAKPSIIKTTITITSKTTTTNHTKPKKNKTGGGAIRNQNKASFVDLLNETINKVSDSNKSNPEILKLIELNNTLQRIKNGSITNVKYVFEGQRINLNRKKPKLKSILKTAKNTKIKTQ